MNTPYLAYLTILGLVGAAVAWAHWYKAREKQSVVRSARQHSVSKPKFEDLPKQLREALEEETERYLYKAVARSTEHRVWRSDPWFSDDGRLQCGFKVLGPGEQPPAEGTIFKWA